MDTEKTVNGAGESSPAPDCSAVVALPDDVRCFIWRVTLHLQANRSKTPEQHDAMLHAAYRLYAKYDVEGRRANAAGQNQHYAAQLAQSATEGRR